MHFTDDDPMHIPRIQAVNILIGYIYNFISDFKINELIHLWSENPGGQLSWADTIEGSNKAKWTIAPWKCVTTPSFNFNNFLEGKHLQQQWGE